MPARVDSKAVLVSLRVFQRLLAAYPKAHREEYGAAMAQLFRDRCRDAWREARGRGLMALWLHVLPDLVKTSVLEHLSALKERKSMLERIGTLFRPRSAPLFVFLAVFVAVFFLVVTTSTVVTFIMPESYASTAYIKVERDVTDLQGMGGRQAPPGYDPYLIQTELEVIQSEVVLGRVIPALDLNSAWGKKYAGGAALRTAESVALLRARLDLRPVRNLSLIEIRAFSEDRTEAAKIANAVTDAYRDYRREQRRQAAVGANVPRTELVDRAEPGLKPVRPNKPLNIFLGIVIGILLGSAAGAGTAGIATLIGRKSRGGSATPGPAASPPPVAPNSADGRHGKGAMNKIMGVLWMGMSAALSGLGLLALIWVFGDAPRFPDFLIIPLFGIFWGGNVFAGFFLFRGKSWARICVGVEAVLLVTYFLVTAGAPVPRALRWVPIAFGAITACALLWPRKEIATDQC